MQAHLIFPHIHWFDIAIVSGFITLNIFVGRFGMWPYSLVTFPGTFAHELAHYLVGKILFASPSLPRLIPKRQGDHWVMGSVSFVPTILNSIPIAFAPLLLCPMGLFFIDRVMTQSTGLSYVSLAWVAANMLQSCLPSSQDLKVATPSVVFAVVVGIAIWFWWTKA